MKTSKEIAGVLNDLIEIHNDRIVGYEKAIRELKGEDEDLKTLFASLISQSHQAKMELGKEVQVLGEKMETSTTNRGKIYRAWMDVKNAFTGSSTHTVLDSCEYGEDAALKAYDEALSEEDIPSFLRDILLNHQNMLLDAHDQVRALRDQYA